MLDVLKVELRAAIRRLETQADTLAQTQATLDAATARKMSSVIAALEAKEKRQKMACEATRRQIVELEAAIAEMTTAEPELPLNPPTQPTAEIKPAAHGSKPRR